WPPTWPGWATPTCWHAAISSIWRWRLTGDGATSVHRGRSRGRARAGARRRARHELGDVATPDARAQGALPGGALRPPRARQIAGAARALRALRAGPGCAGVAGQTRPAPGPPRRPLVARNGGDVDRRARSLARG